jgi:DNA-binding XRE family transcriptional regulator
LEQKKEENLVKKTCKELGITQKELAEKIGVSKQTIYDWSNNRTPIPKWGLTIFTLLSEKKEYSELKHILKNALNNNRIIL